MATDEGNSQNENWTLDKRLNWSSCSKLALSTSWTHDLIAQMVRASERNWIPHIIIILIFIYLFNVEYYTNNNNKSYNIANKFWQNSIRSTDIFHTDIFEFDIFHSVKFWVCSCSNVQSFTSEDSVYHNWFAR